MRVRVYRYHKKTTLWIDYSDVYIKKSYRVSLLTPINLTKLGTFHNLLQRWSKVTINRASIARRDTMYSNHTRRAPEIVFIYLTSFPPSTKKHNLLFANLFILHICIIYVNFILSYSLCFAYFVAFLSYVCPFVVVVFACHALFISYIIKLIVDILFKS